MSGAGICQDLDKLLNFVGASKEQNSRSTKASETQRKARHEVIKRARRTKGIISRIRQDMINNESHFSDNSNGSMDFPTGQLLNNAFVFVAVEH